MIWPFRALLKGLLEPSWAASEASEAASGPSGAVLEPTWAVLRPSWGNLGPSWRHLGPSWRPRWLAWAVLEAILDILDVLESAGEAWAPKEPREGGAMHAARHGEKGVVVP